MMAQTPKQLDPFNCEQLPVSPKCTLSHSDGYKGRRLASPIGPLPILTMAHTSSDQFQYDYALLKILLLTARVPLAFPGAIKGAPRGGQSVNSPPPNSGPRQAITPYVPLGTRLAECPNYVSLRARPSPSQLTPNYNSRNSSRLNMNTNEA